MWWFQCWLCDGRVIFAPFFWLPLPNQDRWLRGTLNSQFHASEHRYFDPFHQSLCLRALERVSVVWIIQPVKLSIHRSVARYWNIIWFQLHAAGLTKIIHLAHRYAIFLCTLKVDNQVEQLTTKISIISYPNGWNPQVFWNQCASSASASVLRASSSFGDHREIPTRQESAAGGGVG